jgi:hypothetical protein
MGGQRRTRHHGQHSDAMLNVHEDEHTAPSNDQHGNHHRRVPVKVVTTSRNRNQQQYQCRTPEEDTSIVNPLQHSLSIRPRLLLLGRWQHNRTQDTASSSNRTQQPKETAPSTFLHKSRGDEWPGHIADSHTRSDHALPFPPLFQRDDVGYNHR